MKKDSTTLAIALHRFFTDYLPRQRALSPHTLLSYRDSLKLLLKFVTNGKADPSRLQVELLTPERVMAYLQYLETERKNTASTRNVRLSAIHSFMRFLGLNFPEHLAQAQRLISVPFKRTGTREIHHLEFSEIQTILRNIDLNSSDGYRDFVLLSFLFNTGARVSEVVGLQACDLRLAAPATVLLRGKGRKERVCPLWLETARTLQHHLERQNTALHEAHNVFLNHRGQPLTRFGIRLILKKRLRQVAPKLPSLKEKRIHPHSLRHSTAIHLLRSGVDLVTIANWLGHVSVNTTNKYLTIDLEAKRAALAKTKPILAHGHRCGRWRTDRNLIEWLESL
jgi:site-specific recombinase XerD